MYTYMCVYVWYMCIYIHMYTCTDTHTHTHMRRNTKLFPLPPGFSACNWHLLHFLRKSSCSFLSDVIKCFRRREGDHFFLPILNSVCILDPGTNMPSVFPLWSYYLSLLSSGSPGATSEVWIPVGTSSWMHASLQLLTGACILWSVQKWGILCARMRRKIRLQS